MMRLDQLDLTRYGRFTDRVLDFGTARPGQVDMHIVYGPNEAGKSTLLAAWLDLLFGIPLQSRYNFLHDYKTMRIGSVLTLADGVHSLTRTKGQKATLTEAGAPLPEATLAAALGGLDRAACEEMFALDAATMEKGGDSILSSQGNLGALLFAATAGLSDLSRKLSQLQDNTAGFWKKGAQKGRLKELKAHLAEIDAQLRALDVQAPEYARRRAAAATARVERDRLQTAEIAARADRDRAQAMLNALPVLAEWRNLTARLAPLDALPDAPAEWTDRVERLIREDVEQAATARATAERQAQLRAALEALTPDEAALGLIDAVAFDDELKAQFLSARRDLPKRREALDALAVQLADLATAAAIAPDSPSPDEGTLAQLEALAANHGALAERARAAAEERAKAEDALERAGGPLEDSGDPDLSQLRAALEPLRSADLPARLRIARAEAFEAGARRDAALARLGPWRGDVAALRELAVPAPETLARWRSRLDAARATHDLASSSAAHRRAQAAHSAAERDGLGAALDEAAPEALARARAARDTAWAAHRAALDDASADRFAAAMVDHDRVAEAQLVRANDLGRFHATRAAAATAELLADRADAALVDAARALDDLRAEVAAALTVPGGDGDDPLAGVAEWLTMRGQTLDLADAADTAARAAAMAEDDAERARAGLAAALSAEGDLSTLATEAHVRLEQAEADAARRGERRRLAATLAQRRAEEAASGRALENWAVSLAETLAATPRATNPPRPERLRGLIASWRDRATTLTRASELRHRIAAMEADQRRFAEAVAQVAAVLGLEYADPLATHAAASARIEEARRIEAQRVALRDDIAKVEAIARAQAEARARHDAEAAEISTHLSAASLPEAQAILNAITGRAELRASAARRAADLCRMLGTASVNQAAAALTQVDTDTLPEALARAEAERHDAEAQLEAARQVLFSADQELAKVTADGAVAQLEARRATVLVTVAEEARHWLRQRAGILATAQALDAYRASHRGTMMARASDAFAQITGGAYTGLTAQPTDKGEQLIALAAGGASKAPGALSKGTRFQLYLALRIAGFAEWTRAHGPLPVIADDIMETFDDERTGLALRALADMSRGGQVIYLTHHRHVCDLAAVACPDARIMTL